MATQEADGEAPGRLGSLRGCLRRVLLVRARTLGASPAIVAVAGAVALCVATGAASSGQGGPTPSGYPERCAAAMAPALGLSPEGAAAGDNLLRRLMKLRYASSFRRLELATERVKDHQDPPEKLLAILEDVGASRLELYEDPSALSHVQEARLGLARLIEEFRKSEMEAGRAGEYELEGARYTRLDAEVRLARTKAAPKAPRRDR